MTIPLTRLLATTLAVIALVVTAPAPGRAQDVAAAARDTAGPRAGTWGAELGIGTGQAATLLRFRSPTSALLFGAEAFVQSIGEDVPSIDGVRTEHFTVASVTARLGLRGYSPTARALRPFGGAGLLAGYVSDPGGPGWTAGAYGELGASYFFSPHVSLGAAGGVQAAYSRLRREFVGGQPLTMRQFTLRASTVQLLGAVYF